MRGSDFRQMNAVNYSEWNNFTDRYRVSSNRSKFAAVGRNTIAISEIVFRTIGASILCSRHRTAETQCCSVN